MAAARRNGRDAAAGDDVGERGDQADRGFSASDHNGPPPDRRSAALLLRLVAAAVRLLWRVAAREVAVAVFFQVLAAIALTAQLLVARKLLAILIPAGGAGLALGSALPYVLGLVVAAALLAFSYTVQAEMTTLIGELVKRRASADVAEVAGSVELDAFDRPGFYDRLQRARINAETRSEAMAASLLGLVSAVCGSLGVAAALFAIEPLIVPLMLLTAIPAWLVNLHNSRRLHRFLTGITPIDREREYLLEALTSREQAHEIRVFAIAGWLRRRHEHLHRRRIGALRRLVWSQVRRALVGDVLGSLITGSALLLLLWLVSRHHMAIASAGTAVFAVLFLAQRVRAAILFASRLYEASLFLEDAQSFSRLKAIAAPRRPTGFAPSRFDRLFVDNVSFTYAGASSPSLKNVSLDLRAGEVVALVGENGSGKTTLAKLLAALYKPTSGRILWDDTDTASCDPYALRTAIALIFQDFVRWALPARENIGLGRSERIGDETAIRDAAQRSGADSFLTRLPAGYDTILSRMFSGGRDLSLGQWQQIALARALFRDAPLVIMDEPTAALDPLAEYRIFETVRYALRGRTLLLISHRFSSVRLADRIFVLYGGELREQGTHNELMERDGEYARMFTIQASTYLGAGFAR